MKFTSNDKILQILSPMKWQIQYPTLVIIRLSRHQTSLHQASSASVANTLYSYPVIILALQR